MRSDGTNYANWPHLKQNHPKGLELLRKSKKILDEIDMKFEEYDSNM